MKTVTVQTVLVFNGGAGGRVRRHRVANAAGLARVLARRTATGDGWGIHVKMSPKALAHLGGFREASDPSFGYIGALGLTVDVLG